MQGYMQRLIEKLRIESIIRYGIAAILIAVPLYPKFPLIAVPGTYVSIRLEDFLILIVAVFWGIYIIPRVKGLLKDKINIAIILFLLVALVSTLSGIFLTKTVVFHIGLLNWLRRVEYMVGFFVAVTFLRSKKDLIFYIKCLAIDVVVVFVYGLGQKYYSWPVITTQNDEFSKGIALRYMPGGHLISTFAGHYDLASFIILVAPIFIVLLFSQKEVVASFIKDKRQLVTKGVLVALLLASYWLIANTASRISSVSFLLCLSLALVLIRKYKIIPVVLLLGFVFFGLSSNLVGRYMEIFNVIVRRATGEVQIVNSAYAQDRRGNAAIPTPTPPPILQDLSTSIRLNVEWPRAIRAFQKNPILGTGFSSITLATDDDYLRALGETGILGLATFLLFLFRIVRKLINNFPIPKDVDLGKAYLIAITASLLGIFLNAVFIDIFEASKFAIVFWILIGFALSGVQKSKV